MEESLAQPELSPLRVGDYESLGMIWNPFAPTLTRDEVGPACEIAAEGNRLLALIRARSLEADPKPVWVEKPDIPNFFPLNAVAHAEGRLAVDDTLNVLYSYVELFMMKVGLLRATLGIVGERLSFRSFPTTLAIYVRHVLENPDETLASFGILGPEGAQSFAARFAEDEEGTIMSVFGGPELERRPEFTEVADTRRLRLPDDGDESDTTEEIDGTIGDAPGTMQLMAEAAENMDAEDAAVLDYIIEYTRTHYSPVLARGLRSYRDRGMAAMSEELRITKAPRKTLGKIIDFALLRYNKVAFIFDMFENWREIDPELRLNLVGSLSTLRWKTAGSAFPVIISKPDEVPEIEEAFGHGTRLQWRFSGLIPLQESKDVLLPDVVNGWLEAATLVGGTPLTMEDEVLSTIADLAENSLSKFVEMARASIDDAARRGVGRLDEAALEAARNLEG